MVHFIGAGPGAEDLITVRGAKLLGEADVIIYAGSLVNPALLNYKKESCAVYDSASMTLEQVIEVMRDTEALGGMTTYPYRLLFPALILSIMILSFNLVGDGLRDALDPKLKK